MRLHRNVFVGVCSFWLLAPAMVAVTAAAAACARAAGASATDMPLAAEFREVTIPRGTHLTVRLNTRVASDTSRREDPVEATLAAPIVVDHHQVLPAGTVLTGVVSDARRSGRVTGRAALGLRFTTLTVSNQAYALAARIHAMAPTTKKKDAETIGLPAAGGAVIGGIVGGKKGAATGALIGGGAGAGVVLATPGKEVRWPRGTRLTLTLEHDVRIRVPVTRPQPGRSGPLAS